MALSDALICTDQYGTVTFSNSAADRLFGHAPEGMRGCNLSQLFPPDGLAAPPGTVIERTGQRRDGSFVRLEIALSQYSRDGQACLASIIRAAGIRPRDEAPSARKEDPALLLPGNGIDYAICRIASDGIVSHWTAGAQRLLGYAADEIIGRHYGCLFTDEDSAAGMPETILQTARRDGKYEGDGWRVRADGSRFWAEVAIDTVRDTDGRTIGLSQIVHDVSERRRVQSALMNSERRLRAFAEMAADWFWEQDADLCFVNESNLPTAGLTVDVGKTRWDVADPAMDPSRWTSHKQDLAARRPFRDFRWERLEPDGSIRYMSSSGDPVFKEDGTFAGYHGIGRDVTRDVKAADELRRAKEAAEAANLAKSEFLANIGHELRTPMHSVLGFAELIRDHAVAPNLTDVTAWAAEILNSGRHLLNLINALLDLSRLEAGRYTLVDRPIDLSLIARACMAIIKLHAEENQVRVKYSVERMQGALLADRRAVMRIMLNLVSNAVKFTPPGGVVSIYAEYPAGGGVALVVSDTGVGIDPGTLPALGKPFTQADGSYGREYGGAGLGLAISGKLAALHGGSLAIDSTPDRGTTVRVIFPRERVISSPAKAN